MEQPERLCVCGAPLQVWSDEVITSKLYGQWDEDVFVVTHSKVIGSADFHFSLICTECYSPADKKGVEIDWQ